MNWTVCVFWISIIMVFYLYLGHPLLIWLFASLWPKPIRRDPFRPTVTLLISAYNEEDMIQRKIKNSLKLKYPRDKLEIVVVTDGSTDATASIVRKYVSQGVKLYHREERCGKSAALDRGVSLTHGDVILFSDANNTIYIQNYDYRLPALFRQTKDHCLQPRTP